MYLSQTINVNLTQENADILKKPSKVFNKIKALFSGGMTPTEQRQASVMLSVLQRLNVALRKSQFDDLVSISANDKLLYEGKDRSNDLNEGSVALTDGFSRGNITQVSTLALTVDAEKENLRYLIHVTIVRTPKGNTTPITIQIYGFLNEFKQMPGEPEKTFSQRIKDVIEKSWINEAQRTEKLKELEAEFKRENQVLQREIDKLFPALSEIEVVRKKVKKEPYKSQHQCHNDRYESCYAYLPLYYQFGVDVDHLEEQDYILEQASAWDNDGTLGNFNTEKPARWVINETIDDSTSDSGGSSCGSSCGGGCSS